MCRVAVIFDRNHKSYSLEKGLSSPKALGGLGRAYQTLQDL